MHRKAPRPLETTRPPFRTVFEVLNYYLYCNPNRQVYKDCLNLQQRDREPRTDDPPFLWQMCHTAITRVEKGYYREGAPPRGAADPTEWKAFKLRYLTNYSPEEEHPDPGQRMASRERQNYTKTYIVRAIAEHLGVSRRTVYNWLNDLLGEIEFECCDMKLIPGIRYYHELH